MAKKKHRKVDLDDAEYPVEHRQKQGGTEFRAAVEGDQTVFEFGDMVQPISYSPADTAVPESRSGTAGDAEPLYAEKPGDARRDGGLPDAGGQLGGAGQIGAKPRPERKSTRLNSRQ